MKIYILYLPLPTHNSSHHKVSYFPLMLLTLYLEFCVQVNHLFLAILLQRQSIHFWANGELKSNKSKMGLIVKKRHFTWSWDFCVSQRVERWPEELGYLWHFSKSMLVLLHCCWHHLPISNGSNTLSVWLHPSPASQSEAAPNGAPPLQL